LLGRLRTRIAGESTHIAGQLTHIAGVITHNSVLIVCYHARNMCELARNMCAFIGLRPRIAGESTHIAGQLTHIAGVITHNKHTIVCAKCVRYIVAMASTLQAMADRQGHPDQVVVAGEILDLRIDNATLSLRAAKVLHLLVHAAGADACQNTRHSVPIADLNDAFHLSTGEASETAHELARTPVQQRYT